LSCINYYRGHEAENAIAFKDALGLSDEEAAPAHLEVAQRMYRQGFESKDRQQQFDQRKVSGFFQISSLIDGTFFTFILSRVVKYLDRHSSV
jgi:hypothetical protein